MKETIKDIPTGELYPFPDNPFQVREDAELQDSIRDYGVISPLVVRPRDGGGYEIISGHRRKAACEKAGIEKVPAFIRCYFSQKMKGKERKRSEINGIKLNNMQKSTPKKRA